MGQEGGLVPSDGKVLYALQGRQKDRGRGNGLYPVPPPSEPDRQISRNRLSSWWFYLGED